MNRPKSINIAFAVMLFGLFMAAVSSIFNTINAPEHFSKPVMASMIVIILSINLFLIYYIFAGKNWARLIYSALLAINILGGVNGPIMEGAHHWFIVINHWLGMGIFIVSLVLLYLPDSNLWFKKCPDHAYKSLKPTHFRGTCFVH